VRALQRLTEQEVNEYDGDILSLDELLAKYPDTFNIAVEKFKKDYEINDDAKSVVEFRKVFGKSLFTQDGRLYEHH
jgi:hypothetical protein